MMGRGRGQPHVAAAAIVGIDYFYIARGGVQRRDELGVSDGEDGEQQILAKRMSGDTIKCLVIRWCLTKAFFGHVVLCKGAE